MFINSKKSPSKIRIASLSVFLFFTISNLSYSGSLYADPMLYPMPPVNSTPQAPATAVIPAPPQTTAPSVTPANMTTTNFMSASPLSAPAPQPAPAAPAPMPMPSAPPAPAQPAPAASPMMPPLYTGLRTGIGVSAGMVSATIITTAASLNDLGSGTYDAFISSPKMYAGDDWDAQVVITRNNGDVTIEITGYFMKFDSASMSNKRDGTKVKGRQETIQNTTSLSGGITEISSETKMKYEGWTKDAAGNAQETSNYSQDSKNVSRQFPVNSISPAAVPVFSYSVMSYQNGNDPEKIMSFNYQEKGYQTYNFSSTPDDNGVYLVKDVNLQYNGSGGSLLGSASSFDPSSITMTTPSLAMDWPGFSAGNYTLRLSNSEVDNNFTGSYSVNTFGLGYSQKLVNGVVQNKAMIIRTSSFDLTESSNSRNESGAASSAASLSPGSTAVATDVSYSKMYDKILAGFWRQLQVEKHFSQLVNAFQNGEIVVVDRTIRNLPLPSGLWALVDQMTTKLNRLQAEFADLRNSVNNGTLTDGPTIFLRLQELGQEVFDALQLRSQIESMAPGFSGYPEELWEQIGESNNNLLPRILAMIQQYHDLLRDYWAGSGPYNPPVGSSPNL